MFLPAKEVGAPQQPLGKLPATSQKGRLHLKGYQQVYLFIYLLFLLPSLLVPTAGIAQKQCEWRKLHDCFSLSFLSLSLLVLTEAALRVLLAGIE